MKPISIGDYFTPQDLDRLNKEYKENHQSATQSLIDIATLLFAKNQIVSLLDLKDDANEMGRYLAIQSTIKQVQAMVITKTKTFWEEVEVKVGEKTITTNQKVKKDAPYYDFMESIRDKNSLEKEIDERFIVPNYEQMREDLRTN